MEPSSILLVLPTDQLHCHVSRIQPSFLLYILQGCDIKSMAFPFSIGANGSEARWVVGELCLDKNGLIEVVSTGAKVFFHDIFLGCKIAKNEFCRGRGEGSRNLGHEELEEPLDQLKAPMFSGRNLLALTLLALTLLVIILLIHSLSPDVHPEVSVANKDLVFGFSGPFV